MNILVTGAAGFIGSNLVHYLLGPAAGETGQTISKVVNLDKLTYAGNVANLIPVAGDPRHIFVQGDIMDSNLVRQLLAEHEIDAMMHLAAESHVDRSITNPEEFIQTNFVGTFRLLMEANHHQQTKPQFRFLHVSTDEVYGSLSATAPAFCETTPYAPNSPYSASKAGSDFLARAFHHTYGLDVVTTNCSNNYGPYQFPEKLIPLMVRKVLRGEKLPVYGDGRQVRDWLYVEDHCRGLLLALLKGRAGETYCLGGRCEMQNLQVVHALISAVHTHQSPAAQKTAAEIITYVTDRPGHDRRYAINCEKIVHELGWAPRENFASGLAKTVAWYVANAAWVDAIEQGTYQGQRLGV